MIINKTRWTLPPAVVCCLAAVSSSANAMADTFGSGGNQFTIDFVTIGNPSNPADTTGDPNPAGSVPHVYRMGQYEVSRDMVTKANAAGGLGITLGSSVLMGVPRPDMPATGVAWNEAARFVNWLNTSEGFSAAYKFTTQPGDVGYSSNEKILLWDSADAGYNVDNPFRNSLAHYFLPSVHEWYKAAYYDPDANGGAGGYWDFPTGSDSIPTAVASGTAAGTAVWDHVWHGPADITLAGGLSPYGVMGLGGNVSEWEETEFDLVNDNGLSARVVRGSNWLYTTSIIMSASFRSGAGPSVEDTSIGFRIASIPAPGSPADFDGDGLVDGDDFLTWQQGLNQYDGNALHKHGDADEDGFVNGDDFLIWQQEFSGSAGTGRSTIAIPEPPTLFLLVIAAASACRRRCGRASRVPKPIR